MRGNGGSGRGFFQQSRGGYHAGGRRPYPRDENFRQEKSHHHEDEEEDGQNEGEEATHQEQKHYEAPYTKKPGFQKERREEQEEDEDIENENPNAVQE